MRVAIEVRGHGLGRNLGPRSEDFRRTVGKVLSRFDKHVRKRASRIGYIASGKSARIRSQNDG